MNTQKCSLLVAEDDENDLLLLKLGLERSGLGLQLLVARDGQEAVDYLAGGGLPGQAELPSRPDLFLLDITMPRLDGWAVLNWLRARPEFRTLPVVVLSYSRLPSDREKALSLGAAGFLVKPTTSDAMAAMLQGLTYKGVDQGFVKF